MSAAYIVEALHTFDDSSIFSTGNDPSLLKDLLVVGSLPRETYLNELERFEPLAEFRSEQSDDALLLHADKARVGVAYYEREKFLETVGKLLNGEMVDPVVKPWSTGPWLPEAFASDLSRSVALRLQDECVLSALQYTKMYPTELSTALIARCTQEIIMKTNMVDKTQKESLQHDYLAADICLAGVRLIHAKEKIYFRGLKYVTETKGSLSAESVAIVTALESTDNYNICSSIISA